MPRFSVTVENKAWRRPIPARDIQFTKTARGGFESANMTLSEELVSTNPSLVPGARLRIHDHTAQTIFEGYLDLPGKSALREGQEWKIGAVGAATLLSDKSRAWIGIDTDLQKFTVLKSTSPGATAGVSSLPSDEDQTALILQFPAGQPVDNTSTISMIYQEIANSGQRIGGFSVVRVAGRNAIASDMHMKIATKERGVGGSNEFPRDAAFNTTPVAAAGTEVTTHWSNNTSDTLRVLASRDAGGATNVTTDTLWAAFYNLWVRAQLRDQAGAYKIGAGDNLVGYLLAHEVVIDGLWHFADILDIAGAEIDETFAYQIDQLSYPDGTTLADMLSDLSLLEPDMTWGVFETSPAELHRFRLGQYGSDVRYLATTADGWEQPGGELGLSNELTVYYTDVRGKSRPVTVTTAVDVLDQWARVRSADTVDLGTEVGSAASAQQIAEGLLDQASVLEFSGTLTVARPIMDLLRGRMVMPWQIEPGYLVQVLDIADAPPMRLTEMSYTDSSQSASLTLGTPTFSTDELVAKLAKRRHRKGGKPVSASYA